MKKLLYFILVALSFVSCSSCEKEETPTVKTVKAVFVANEISVDAAGRIVSDGGADVARYGICLSQNTNPTINDIKVEHNGDGAVSFTGKFDSLELNNIYYVRAYAINSEGVGYGEALEVETKVGASVATKEATGIGLNTATINGSVNPNNLPTEVWAEYGETTSYGTKVSFGTFEGVDEIEISANLDLTPGKVYYFIFKGKNKLGEVSGSQLTLKTYGLEDIDGNLYHTVVINGRVWIVENLRTTRYNDGAPITNKTADADWSAATGVAEPAYCWVGNDIANKEIFGALYNWYAASSPKIAPIGWHVPTYEEYQALIAFLGGENTAGGALKSTTSIWQAPNTGATNSSGFSLIPAGNRADNSTGSGKFGNAYKYGVIWTSSEYSGYGENIYVGYDTQYVETSALFSKAFGLSIRLIKD